MDEPRSEPGAATPEGYTKEEPAVTEIGERGTPGAGMTPDAPHAADADLIEHGDEPADPVPVAGSHVAGSPVADASVAGSSVAADPNAAQSVAHHDAVTHMDTHTTLSDDDHGHAESVLGPIDWGAWSYAIAGAIAAVIVLAFFFVAIGGSLG